MQREAVMCWHKKLELIAWFRGLSEYHFDSGRNLQNFSYDLTKAPTTHQFILGKK